MMWHKVGPKLGSKVGFALVMLLSSPIVIYSLNVSPCKNCEELLGP